MTPTPPSALATASATSPAPPAHPAVPTPAPEPAPPAAAADDARAQDAARLAAGELSLLADAVRVGTGAVRLGAGAGWKLAEWYVRGSVDVTRRLVRGAAAGESAPQLFGEVVEEWRDRVRELLGIEELEDRTGSLGPVSEEPLDEAALRARGAELLRRSADVSYEEPFHPAYGRILELLAPDEARVLRLLTVEGAQPTVDVRTASPLPSSSELLAAGLSMIAAAAGCRFPDRVPAYLNNLFRLGLVWFSREPVEDLGRYQVLEAQPEVLRALDAGKRTRTVRRSVHLTPFGADFCRICIPTDALADPPVEG